MIGDTSRIMVRPVRVVAGGWRLREDVDSLIPRDIYNFRQKKHFEFLDGRTPIQALLTPLPDEGNWIFNYEKTADGVVTALFCTHRTCLEILESVHPDNGLCL